MSMNKTRKIAAGLAAVAAAGSLMVGGVFAAFTDTAVTAPQTIGAGTVSLALADSSNATPPVKFTQTISAIAPGDIAYRALTVTNNGTLNMASVGMTSSATPSNLLTTTTPASGLGVTIDMCSQAWTIGSPTAAPTCGGTTTPVKTITDIAGLAASTNISGSVLTAGGSAYLMFKYEMNASAGDALEGLSTDVTYTFNATQRTAVTSTQ